MDEAIIKKRIASCRALFESRSKKSKKKREYENKTLLKAMKSKDMGSLKKKRKKKKLDSPIS